MHSNVQSFSLVINFCNLNVTKSVKVLKNHMKNSSYTLLQHLEENKTIYKHPNQEIYCVAQLIPTDC